MVDNKVEVDKIIDKLLEVRVANKSGKNVNLTE